MKTIGSKVKVNYLTSVYFACNVNILDVSSLILGALIANDL